MTRIAGSHVIVTGGSLGIGMATARACAAWGARVSIIGRDHERLAAAQQQLKQQQPSTPELGEFQQPVRGDRP